MQQELARAGGHRCRRDAHGRLLARERDVPRWDRGHVAHAGVAAHLERLQARVRNDLDKDLCDTGCSDNAPYASAVGACVRVRTGNSGEEAIARAGRTSAKRSTVPLQMYGAKSSNRMHTSLANCEKNSLEASDLNACCSGSASALQSSHSSKRRRRSKSTASGARRCASRATRAAFGSRSRAMSGSTVSYAADTPHPRADGDQRRRRAILRTRARAREPLPPRSGCVRHRSARASTKLCAAARRNGATDGSNVTSAGARSAFSGACACGRAAGARAARARRAAR